MAIAGAGLMGRFHARAAVKAGTTLVGIADPDHTHAAALTRRHRKSQSFRDTAEMLAATKPDILHICTPTETHEDLIRQALHTGAHVFVEKPLAASEQVTRDLLGLAAKTDLLICPVHQYAFQRSIETILAQRARIGPETHIDLVFHSAGGAAFDHADHYLVAADILPHAVSILQRLYPEVSIGETNWHIASAGPSTWEMSGDMANVSARILISLAARPTCITLNMHGISGAFRADMFHDFVQFRPGKASRRTKITQPFTDALGQFSAASVNLAGRALRSETAYPGLRALTLQFYQSCLGKRPVPIEARTAIDVAILRDQFLDATCPSDRYNAAEPS